MITVHYDSKPIYNIVFGKNFEEAIPHLKELGLERKFVLYPILQWQAII